MARQEQSDGRPNIVFILMDDMGWRDLSCYGSTFYETPNIDRLAHEGLRFTDAYAACPVCSPTRASIMSGKYPATVGVTDWIDHGDFHPCRGKLIDVPYVKGLPLKELSLASALREGGYRTWHVGKWHLGLREMWPDRHGFDVNVGAVCAVPRFVARAGGADRAGAGVLPADPRGFLAARVQLGDP